MDPVHILFNPLFFPITSLVLLPPLDWETLHESFWRFLACFLSIAFYIATSLWAGFVAYRHRFSQYRLDIVRSVDSAVLGTFFFWPYCFFYVLLNRRRILQGEAKLLADCATYAKKSKAAFLEVLTWAVLWFVIMAAAIPGMVPSRVRVQERQATVALRTFARAQNEYRAAGGQGYNEDLRDLFLDPDGDGRPRFRISRHRIDAYAGSPGLEGAAVPSNGYLFYDDPYVAANGLRREEFGYFAFPVKPGATGFNTYWIGKDGVVLRQEAWRNAEAEDAVTSDNSPLNPKSMNKWEKTGRLRQWP